jgi:hypothetical protein
MRVEDRGMQTRPLRIPANRGRKAGLSMPRKSHWGQAQIDVRLMLSNVETRPLIFSRAPHDR